MEAKQYGILYTTLLDRLKSGNSSKLSLGRPPIFTAAQKKEMTGHIFRLTKLLYGLAVVDLLKLAFTYAERVKAVHNFCKDTQ
jgi:hypothetical protein